MQCQSFVLINVTIIFKNMNIYILNAFLHPEFYADVKRCYVAPV